MIRDRLKLTALLFASLLPLGAGATTTLRAVCGAEGAAMSAGDGQHQLLCRTAYVNANSAIVNDNNSRVYGSVAVVCAYSCIGGSSSCSQAGGGSGGSCSTAVDTGHKAVDASDQSDSDILAAKANGHNALQLKSGVVEIESNAFLPQGSSAATAAAASGGGGSSLPAVCRTANETGSVQSRIACASATDPALPAFVKSPQFQADFQKITGQPLSAVINEESHTLLDRYATSALQNAYGSLGGSVSFTEFTSRAGQLASGIIGSFSDSKLRGLALASIVPSSLQNLLPAIPNGPGSATALASVGTSTSGLVSGTSDGAGRNPASADGGVAISAGGATDSGTTSGGASLLAGLGSGGGTSSLDYGNAPENNPTISIFERVSHRYQSVTGRLQAQALNPSGYRGLASP